MTSKGYIVLSTTAKGEYTKLQSQSVRSIHVQADDIGYLLEFGRRFTKNDKIGTMGFSRGGLANIIFAFKNKNIDATISIDGSIFSQGWLEDIEQSFYYKPNDFSSNLLMITKNLANPQLNPSTFYDKVKYSDKCLLRFDHDNHNYFSAYYLLTDLIINRDLSEEEKDKYFKFYSEMTEYIGAFLDFYLNGKGEFKEHINKRFKHSFSFAKPERKVLNPDNINFWIMEQGADYVNRIVEDILKYQPDYLTKLSWRDLNNSADEMIREGKYEEAIKVLLLSNRAFPGWYLTNHKLGMCYQEVSNTYEAEKYYKLALLDNPRDVKSIDALRDLKITPEDYHKKRIRDDAIKKYLGKYRVDENRYREIYIKNNDVFILSNYWDRPLKVWPYSETLFLIEEDDTRSNLQLIFQFDNNGKVVSLKTRGLNSGRLGEANIKE